MRNKGVLRLHERLNRDQTKKQEDDRSRRLGEWWEVVLTQGLCLAGQTNEARLRRLGTPRCLYAGKRPDMMQHA